MSATVYIEETQLPSATRALSDLVRIDYADAFRLAMPDAGDRTAEAWARTMLEDAPASMRKALREGWRALGLRLRPTDDPGAVLGWPLAQSTSDHAVLATTSRLGMRAELVFVREADALRFSTLITLGNPLVRLMWGRIEGSHRRIVRRLLEQAARRADCPEATPPSLR